MKITLFCSRRGPGVGGATAQKRENDCSHPAKNVLIAHF